jgi:hypothetical protein
MRAIKGLVIGMGVLLVGGLALLVYGISQKAGNPEYKMFRSNPAAKVPVAGFGETRLPLPEGCDVTEMRPDGPLLYLRIGPAGACERIVVIDAATGLSTGSIWLRP